METMLGFAGVAVITTLALFAALAIESALLHGMLRLMQPATAARSACQSPMVRGWSPAPSGPLVTSHDKFPANR